MKQALFQYMGTADSDAKGDSAPLLRNVSRPVSSCPLFHVHVETEHTWPSASLLSGTTRCAARYVNGAHLVMSDNRLLVVRGAEHFYCPPWDTPIHDAHIQRYEPEGHLLLTVGLADSLYIALLWESLPLQIVDDVFVKTGVAVERIFFPRVHEVVLCLANADVVTYLVALTAERRLSVAQHTQPCTTRWMRAISTMWAGKHFRDAAYDAHRGILFVLSSVNLTVWTRAPGSRCFAILTATAIPGGVVAVVAGSRSLLGSLLITADGGRIPLFLNTATPSLHIGMTRPLPPDCRVGDVVLASRGQDGATLLYDIRGGTLFLFTNAASLLRADEGGDVETVTAVALGSDVVGLACVSEVEEPGAHFVVYGHKGLRCRIHAKPSGEVLCDLLNIRPTKNVSVPFATTTTTIVAVPTVTSSLRLTGNVPGVDISILLQQLGPRQAVEVAAMAAFIGGATVSSALAPILANYLRPTARGRTVVVSDGTRGLMCVVRRALYPAETLWVAPFSWRLAADLRRVAATLRNWRNALDALLRPGGWLDCAMPEEWIWRAGLVAESQRPANARGAANAQAALLCTAFDLLSQAATLCWLRAVLLDMQQSRNSLPSAHTNTVAATAAATGAGGRGGGGGGGGAMASTSTINATSSTTTAAAVAATTTATTDATISSSSCSSSHPLAPLCALREFAALPEAFGSTSPSSSSLAASCVEETTWREANSPPFPLLEHILYGPNPDGAAASLCMAALTCSDVVRRAAALLELEAHSSVLPLRGRLAVGIHGSIARGDPEAALTFACDNCRALREVGLLGEVAVRLEAAFPACMPHLRLLLCCRRHGGGVSEVVRLLDVAATPEEARRRLDTVLEASAEDDTVLRAAVLRWVMDRPLEDPRCVTLADVLAAHGTGLTDAPHTLMAAFCGYWAARSGRPLHAARGFSVLARTSQRLALGTRLMCIRLALDCDPSGADQLVYFLLLLQEELADTLEAAGADTEELRFRYVEERRLFELAGQYRTGGGAKVQLDILKVHPETPEKVTAEVLQHLLTYLVEMSGISATDAVRNVVREYYNGYAAGLPLAPFIEFLAEHGAAAGDIAALLTASGVPPYAIFDAFLSFLDERGDYATFSKGAAASTLAFLVTKLQGENRGLCGAYLLERIRHHLADEHRISLGDEETAQLQSAEATLRMALATPSVPLT